jgi:hypothetical protein
MFLLVCIESNKAEMPFWFNYFMLLNKINVVIKYIMKTLLLERSILIKDLACKSEFWSVALTKSCVFLKSKRLSEKSMICNFEWDKAYMNCLTDLIRF